MPFGGGPNRRTDILAPHAMSEPPTLPIKLPLLNPPTDADPAADSVDDLAIGLDWLARHGDCLFAYALSRTRSADVAEDLVQETFLAAIGCVDRFANRSTPETWLIGILRHKLADHYRHLARRASAISSIDHIGLDELTTAGRKIALDSPCQTMEESELRAIVDGCIDELPDLMRQAIEFRVVDQMESAEVCKVLGISPNNLAARLYRARNYVRTCLDDRWRWDP